MNNLKISTNNIEEIKKANGEKSANELLAQGWAYMASKIKDDGSVVYKLAKIKKPQSHF